MENFENLVLNPLQFRREFRSLDFCRKLKWNKLKKMVSVETLKEQFDELGVEPADDVMDKCEKHEFYA